MAARGNKAIPFAVLQGKGNKRTTRHGEENEQLQIEAKIPQPPRIGHKMVLGREGRKEWKRVTDLLKKTHVLTEADRGVLTQYCALWEQFVKAPADFNAASHTQLRLCAVELGFTPSARVKLRNRD